MGFGVCPIQWKSVMNIHVFHNVTEMSVQQCVHSNAQARAVTGPQHSSLMVWCLCVSCAREDCHREQTWNDYPWLENWRSDCLRLYWTRIPVPLAFVTLNQGLQSGSYCGMSPGYSHHSRLGPFVPEQPRGVACHLLLVPVSPAAWSRYPWTHWPGRQTITHHTQTQCLPCWHRYSKLSPHTLTCPRSVANDRPDSGIPSHRNSHTAHRPGGSCLRVGNSTGTHLHAPPPCPADWGCRPQRRSCRTLPASVCCLLAAQHNRFCCHHSTDPAAGHPTVSCVVWSHSDSGTPRAAGTVAAQQVIDTNNIHPSKTRLVVDKCSKIKGSKCLS